MNATNHPPSGPAVNWQDARRRVLKSYREWLRAVRRDQLPIEKRDRILRGHRQAPEVQQMYSLNMPVSKIRTKVRSEFEKHRYVNQLGVVDVLLFQSHSEFQVSDPKGFEEADVKVWDADPAIPATGNTELLEAAGACHEVLQSGGRSNGEVADEFYIWVFGGRLKEDFRYVGSLRADHDC